MKKIFTLLFCISSFSIFAAVSLHITKTSPTGNLHQCSDATFNCTIQNTGSSLTVYSFTLVYDSKITIDPSINFPLGYGGTVSASIPVSGDPLKKQITVSALTSSSPSPGSPYVLAASSTSTLFSFTMHVPCLILPAGSIVSSLNLTETVTCNYSISPSIATASITNSVDYANLFLDASHTTISTRSNMGGVTTRTIRLESASTVEVLGASTTPTSFTGYISFTDNNLSCNLYKIKKITLRKVARFPAATGTCGGISPITIIDELTPATPFSPGLIYTSTVPITFNRECEYLEILEDVVLETTPATAPHCMDACPAGQINNDFIIRYGCSLSDLCNQIPIFHGSIRKGTNLPNLVETKLPYTNSCLLESSFTSLPSAGFVTHTRYVTNTGTANAYNIRLRLAGVSTTSSEIIQRGSLQMMAPDASTLIMPTIIEDYVPTTPSSWPVCVQSFKNLNPSSTDDDEPISSADWEYAVLKPGERLTLTYTTYRCCPSDTNKAIGNFIDPEYFDVWRLRVISDPDADEENVNECGGEVRYTEYINVGPTIADLQVHAMVGPSNLTGTSSCDITHPTMYYVPFGQFCGDISASNNERLFTNTAGGVIGGKLKVIVLTERGLNPSPGTPMTIGSFASTSTIINCMPGSTSSYMTAPTPSGGAYEAEFDLSMFHLAGEVGTYAKVKNFIEQAYLKFPITPCCPGDATPTIRVQFYLVPPILPSAGTCVNCMIPLAQANKKIQLHCPGCVTPGVIADACEVERITPGYLDINDNGLAESTTPAYTDVAGMISAGGYIFAANSFMMGDQIKVKVGGFAQDGDDANHGVSYTTLVSSWTAHGAGYPTGFTHLNIEIVNPCATTSQFSWTPVSGTEILKVSRTVGGTTTVTSFDISAYRVSTGRSYFYRVPASVIGNFLISIYTPERYDLEILFNTCGNGDAQNCEINTRMWWSGVGTHGPTSWDTKPVATSINNATIFPPILPEITSLSEADYRATKLIPDMIYLCEAFGSNINGYHIKETYTSRWIDKANPSFTTCNSCNKLLVNSYTIKACGEDPTITNVFPREFRPLYPSTLVDNFEFPSSLLPNYTYTPVGSSSGSTFKNWTSSSGFSPTSPAIIPSSLSSPASSTITGPYSIAVEGGTSTAARPDFYLSDEQTNLSFSYNFVPTSCAVPGTTTAVSNTNNHMSSSNPCALAATNTYDPGYSLLVLHAPNPSIQVFVEDEPITISSRGGSCFNILVSNNSAGNALAENIRIHIPAPSSSAGIIGSIVAASIVTASPGVSITTSSEADGSLNCYINRLAKSASLAESVELNICLDITSCDPFLPLELSTTFGCTPDDRGCLVPLTTAVHLNQAEVNLYGTLLTPMPASGAACTDITLASDFYLTNVGEVGDLSIVVTLPAAVSDPIFSVTARGSLASCGPTPLPPTISHTTLPSGLIEYNIELDPDYILTLLPCAKDVLLSFTFSFGTCATGPINPIIDIHAYKYCDQSHDVMLSLSPPLSAIVNITGSACSSPTVNYTKVNPSCLGATDGSITITAPLPLSDYTYLWDDASASTTSSIDHLTARTYSVTITDKIYHCETVTTISLSAPPSSIPLPVVVSSTSTCDFGEITISNEGVSGYSYTWTCAGATPASGSFIPAGTSTTFSTGSIHFPDPDMVANLVIHAVDAAGCYNEMTVAIPACCAIGNGPVPGFTPFEMISNLDLSGYTFGAAAQYRMNGLITVSGSTTIEGKDFYMEPNCEIRLLPGATLTIKSCTFVACADHMWKGFNLQAGSHLIAQRSAGTTNDTRIYDALAGVTSWGGADYDLDHVQMNRNFIDVDVKEFMTTSHPSSMSNCNFFCQYESWGYYGTVVPPADGTMFAPHTGEKTKIGVNIINNKLEV